MSQSIWKPIGICPEWQCDERLWHAGLSEDGTKCFVAGFDDNVYIVWDIGEQRVVWRDDGTDGESKIQPLDSWIDADGYITVENEETRGRYRIFGLNLNHAKTASTALNQVLEVNKQDGTLLVRERGTGAVLCRLSFDAFSGNWAVASFSDDDSVIAVIEPYSVTFFGQEKEISE